MSMIFTISRHLRLQAQLEEKEADLKDSVSSLQTKHTAELQRLKEMLAATETTNTDLQKEVSGAWNETVTGVFIDSHNNKKGNGQI